MLLRQTAILLLKTVDLRHIAGYELYRTIATPKACAKEGVADNPTPVAVYKWNALQLDPEWPINGNLTLHEELISGSYNISKHFHGTANIVVFIKDLVYVNEFRQFRGGALASSNNRKVR